MRIDTRPEPRQGTRRQLRERRLLTRRAAQPQPGVLEHQRADHRQLELLMAHRIADPLLAAVKHMPATATVRQMRDPLVQPLGRDQLPASCPDAPAGRRTCASSACTPPAPTGDARPETPADPTTAACRYSPSSGQGDARAPRPAHAAARPRQATPAPAPPPAPRPPTRSPLPRHAARTQTSMQHAGTLLTTTTPP